MRRRANQCDEREVTLITPGDTNGDDLVDIADYQAIVSHLNLFGQTTTNGDVTDDGPVDLRDLQLWRASAAPTYRRVRVLRPRKASPSQRRW